MNQQLTLTDAEWKLLIELLEREQSELPAEIHHTRTSAVRDELRERLEMINRLLARLHGAVGPQQEHL
jgi:hypothetical protein